MLAGLLLTSISTLTMRSALFQRKARSGWLEELDGIREDALEVPDGPVDQVVDANDIWTDLREGGVYEDPHEISSLYADDDTPDLPTPRAAAKPAKPRGRARAKAAEAPVDPSVVAAPLPAHEPELEVAAPMAALAGGHDEPVGYEALASVEGLTAIAAAPGEIEEASTNEAWLADLPAAEPPTSDASSTFDTEPAWVQPAPHPVRPSEMWHPADLAPPSLGEETTWATEERLHAAELVSPAAAPSPAPSPALSPQVQPEPAVASATPVEAVEVAPAFDAAHVQALEDELVVSASAVFDVAAVAPIDPSIPSEGGLVNGPVGRRVRRDRPTDLPRPSALPQATEPAAAAMPAAAIPAAAVTVVEPSIDDVVDPAPHHIDDDRSPLPEAPLPPAAMAPAGIANRTVAEPPAQAQAPAPAPEPPAVSPLVPSSDGMVAVPGTIVRLGGARRAAAARTPEGVVVDLVEGWTWVAPGDGEAMPVTVELPTALAIVSAGATVLSVVEVDGSSFVFVAAGSVRLRRGDEGADLARGAIAMLDPSGAAQVDQASDEELASDPIVAENLAADAEL